MVYTVSDIHGDLETFKALLKEVHFNENDTLYILGDVVDRGPQSIELLLFIIEHSNMILIRGNHEQLMIDGIKHQHERSLWYYNDGEGTHAQFDCLNVSEQTLILNYLEQTPLYKRLEVSGRQFALVHGCYPTEFEDEHADYYLWERIDENRIHDYYGFTVVFGHTPTSYYQKTEGGLQIYHAKNKVGIDCGLVTHPDGQLGCLRLDDMAEFYQMRLNKNEPIKMENEEHQGMVENVHFGIVQHSNLVLNDSPGKFDVICNLCQTTISSSDLDSYCTECACKTVSIIKSGEKLSVVNKRGHHDYSIKYSTSQNTLSYVNGSYILPHTLETISNFLKIWVASKPIKQLELFGSYYFDDIDPFSEVCLLIESVESVESVESAESAESAESIDLTIISTELSNTLGVRVICFNNDTLEQNALAKSLYLDGSLVIIKPNKTT